jgi:hypothetical protein
MITILLGLPSLGGIILVQRQRERRISNLPRARAALGVGSDFVFDFVAQREYPIGSIERR